MEWTQEALQALDRIPEHVRSMAKSSVEKAAQEQGLKQVDANVMQAIREKYFGFVEKEAGDKKTTKIAIVRCDIVSESCPGAGCMKAFNHRAVHFEQYGPEVELIGFFTCGGCSGRRVVRLVEKLKAHHDLDIVHMSSCMLFDGDYPKCPFKTLIKQGMEAKGVKVVEGTHH